MKVKPSATCDHCQRPHRPVVLIEADGSSLFALSLCAPCLTMAMALLLKLPGIYAVVERSRDLDTPEPGA